MSDCSKNLKFVNRSFSKFRKTFGWNKIKAEFNLDKAVYVYGDTFFTLFYLKGMKSPTLITAQKMKFSIKDLFSKCYQIRRKLRIGYIY